MALTALDRYSVYSDKTVDPRRSEKLSGFQWSEFGALAPMSFIFKRQFISQAGRRGFDPRLPLHYLALRQQALRALRQQWGRSPNPN
jgi:hypothetical protein